MDENRQEKLSIVRFFFVALLIVVAIFLFGYVTKMNFENIVIISAITFEIFLINCIFSNHLIKQGSNIQDSINKLKESIDNLKVKTKKKPEEGKL